jgi:hypothetical protein
MLPYNTSTLIAVPQHNMTSVLQRHTIIKPMWPLIQIDGYLLVVNDKKFHNNYIQELCLIQQMRILRF